jgi:hypothetical protein
MTQPQETQETQTSEEAHAAQATGQEGSPSKEHGSSYLTLIEEWAAWDSFIVNTFEGFPAKKIDWLV